MYLRTNAQIDVWVREDESDSWSPKAQRIIRWAKRRSSDTWGHLIRIYAAILVTCSAMFVAGLLFLNIIASSETRLYVSHNLLWLIVLGVIVGLILLVTRPFIMPNGNRIVKRLKAELRPGQIIDESDPRLQAKGLGFYTRWPDPVAGEYIDRYLYETAPLAAGFGSQKAIERCAVCTHEAIDAYRKTGEVNVMNLRTVLQPIVNEALQPNWPAPTPGSLA
ncbi:MAG: hypothetical protein WBP12_02220 [Candidatus Saccharimonas sp.]